MGSSCIWIRGSSPRYYIMFKQICQNAPKPQNTSDLKYFRKGILNLYTEQFAPYLPVLTEVLKIFSFFMKFITHLSQDEANTNGGLQRYVTNVQNITKYVCTKCITTDYL